MTVTIWHNPRCSKSRQAMTLLEEKGVEPQVRKYLEDVPGADEIRAVLAMLDIGARDLMRTKEALYKELALDEEEDEAKLIAAMVANPGLIERPVVINKGKARIGRPTEAILEIL
ncbi:arsenate reductase (glutaredoxin) [uncultured Cohaesibacter sp.]|uniref:arsenate reductase (glutaredoxin) n=1 Tax=uncultured Cohaesibacter sp. TaxID=1002546 RepID=UPI00292F9804|nr:arsenate reductase (glutaredoxin) [uncultured Cohaesibacter sp.]